MQIRRPLAALMTALALFGGGVSMTGCQASGEDQNDGTTDVSNNDSGNNPADESMNNVPDLDEPESGTEDQNDDTQDPD